MTEIDFSDPYWGDYSGVGPGWHQIVLDLDKKLREVVPGFQWAQVKEKFGGLRAYTFVEGASEKIIRQVLDLTDAAEAQAWKTCERCGQPGRLREDRSWLLTLCDECDSVGKP